MKIYVPQSTKIWICLCLFLKSAPCLAQYDWLAEWKRDSIQVDRLVRKHNKFLPHCFRSQVGILEQINQELFKDSFVLTPQFMYLNALEYDRVRQRFYRLADAVDTSFLCIKRLQDALFILKKQCIEKQVVSHGYYHSQKQKLVKTAYRKYIRSLDKARWRENWVAIYAFAHFHKRETRYYPMMTTMISRYIDFHAQDEIDELDGDIKKAKDAKAKLEQSLKELANNLIKQEDSIKIAKSILQEQDNNIVRSVEQRKEVEKSLGIAREKLLAKTTENTSLETALQGLKRDYGYLLKDLNIKRQKLATLDKRVDSMLHLRSILQDSTRRLSENIRFLDTTIDRQNETIESKEKTIAMEKSIREMVTIFLLMTLFGIGALFFALLQWRRTTKRLKRVYDRLKESQKNLRHANEQLDKEAKKQEDLREEMHHRIKNNLSTISSLLWLQADHLPKSPEQHALYEMRGRIEAISMIHSQLYAGKNMGYVEMGQYARRLIDHLVKVNCAKPKTVEIDLNIANFDLHIDTATDVGLWLNELTQNAFKHAFPHTVSPRLSVDLALEDKMLCARIADNGLGLQEGMEIDQIESFGMKFARKVAEGGHGEMKYYPREGGGTVFELRLPL